MIQIVAGKISAQGPSSQEDSEAIADVIAFTKDELKQGLTQGFVEVSMQGVKQKVFLRDAFFTFAFLQAELREIF